MSIVHVYPHILPELRIWIAISPAPSTIFFDQCVGMRSVVEAVRGNGLSIGGTVPQMLSLSPCAIALPQMSGSVLGLISIIRLLSY